MKKYSDMSKEELLTLKAQLDKEYADIKAKGLALDMSRGKPSADQLNLSMGLMNVLSSDSDLKCETGVDCRNYGVIDGIPEAKRLLGEMSEVDPDHIIIYGNSSLNVMFDSIARSMTHGVMGNTPWCKLDKVKFLCPVPGYDRHFKITEFFGIEMINVPMTPQGPDMDMVEKLVSEDASIKGIWCVPKYSNPQGYTYSAETVERFAHLKPAAPDFRIYWDNAYSIHHLYDDNQDFLVEILEACAKAGNPDLVYKFTSTSKVSFPGSGIAAVAASKANLEDFRSYMQIQTIGHDKLNQLRHVKFFKNIDGLHEHMRKHAAILRPKFEMVLNTLDRELGGLGIGEWTKPHGGYFISFDSMEGCAKAIVAKAKEEADEIVRQAQENADAIRQQAQEDGYQTGLEQGRIEAKEELQKQSEAFTQEMDQKRAELEEQEKKLEPAFAELVVSLVRKITGISCENKKDIILYLIGNSLRNIEKTSHITIRVSKEDISRVAAKKSTLKAIAKDSAELEVVEDSSLEAMQCIIETDHSMIDCSLDAQLQNLEDHVKLLLY